MASAAAYSPLATTFSPQMRCFAARGFHALTNMSSAARNSANPAGTIPAFFMNQQTRLLNVHEFQGADIMSQHGVRVPLGIACKTPEEVKAASDKLQVDGEVVLKSQILAGGRGLGHFPATGLQGGVHICTAEEAPKLAEKMFGQQLVTKQSGPEGKPVHWLYVAKKMALAREMYFAILLDRASAGPMIIGCSEGGTSIEDLAEKFPEKIIKMPININTGPTDAQLDEVVSRLGVKSHLDDAKKQIAGLYETFNKCDCTMLEVNPLAEDTEGMLIAADAKLNFDDNASFRQKDIFALKDDAQADPREVAAAKYDLNYIGLDGSIGCMVNGAGLAMATMDIVSLHGGSPANFLDVGGSASEGQIVEAFKILTADHRVKALLVNIFGGIMKCDVIAAGIVAAAKQVNVTVPLVVRLEGTNVDAGKEILKSSGINIIAADDLDDAAKKAVLAAA